MFFNFIMRSQIYWLTCFTIFHLNPCLVSLFQIINLKTAIILPESKSPVLFYKPNNSSEYIQQITHLIYICLSETTLHNILR
jgi:hypothetical protein